MVESMLSFTSICEAANVTGVAEFDVVSLKRLSKMMAVVMILIE